MTQFMDNFRELENHLFFVIDFLIIIAMVNFINFMDGVILVAGSMILIFLGSIFISNFIWYLLVLVGIFTGWPPQCFLGEEYFLGALLFGLLLLQTYLN